MTDESAQASRDREDKKINAAIRYMCDRRLGVLDSTFLCQSMSALELKAPVCVKESDSVEDALRLLRDNKIGCLLVLDDKGKVEGIFSERDCVLKLSGFETMPIKEKISKYMTPDPVTAGPDTTVAFALNLMSQGGFRHIPIVDGEGLPLGLVSVKDVIDHLVGTFIGDLLNFDVGDIEVG